MPHAFVLSPFMGIAALLQIMMHA